MKQKIGWKKMGMKFLTVLTALSLLWQPLDINAAAWGRTSDSYTVNGTFHIDQFGEYDINAEVTVTDGVITAVEITGDNFGGTYGDYNQNVNCRRQLQVWQRSLSGWGIQTEMGSRGWTLYQGPPILPTGSKERL